MSDTKDIESMLDALTNGCRHSGPLNDYDKRRRAAILAAFAELQRERDQYRNDALGLTSVLAERDARIAELEAALSNIEAVTCDPEGNVCIRGSDGDRAVIQRALAARKGEQSCTSKS